MKIFTIYKATNTVNNKSYIGFDSNWPKRISQHKSNAVTGSTSPFCNAIRKHGWTMFNWEPIYQSTDGEHCLRVMENYFINEHRTFIGYTDSNGYNLTLGGEGVLGHKKSQKAINSQREKMTGRKQTPEHIAHRVESARLHPNFGRSTGPRPAEFGKAISKRLTGVPKSESHKLSMKNRPQDTTVISCPHCNKTGDYKNMKRWHMDRCKHNPNKLILDDKFVTCMVCGFTSKQSPNFYRYHNSNCNGFTK